jgi:alkanesulfonate monooxygenase SsuD/methylene tetrahydromethanopterin reductase-like flavin-dependent oxidoreductase (luciferase family)
MKFNFFHLMPYAYLPEDFEERARSASLTFPNGNFDREKGHKLYHRYLDELEYAERLGYDGICVNEHHQSAYGLMPAPNIMAAALARRTSRATILVIGNAIGLRDHPLRVAEEMAMLDHLTDGRLVSGFVRGIGWEYFGHSINPVHSRERFNEAHDLIIKAWTTDDVFQWIGKHYEFRYVNLWPRTLQEPHPPIYIPGVGSTETMKFCAERRYTYMSVYAPTRLVKRWFDGYRSACEDAGYEADPESIGLSIPIYIAEDHETARREARQHIEWLFHKGLKQGPEIVWPPGYMSAASLGGILKSRMKPFPELTYEELLENGMIIVGSPESAAEQFEALRDELGFGQVMALMAIGDMPHHRVARTMELFASEIMPSYRTPQETEALAATT